MLISVFYYSFLVRKAGLAPLSLDKLQREKGQGKNRQRKKIRLLLEWDKVCII